ncbi:MAG: hypothetical protein ABI945_07850 [Nitrospirales bacterium]
MSTPLKRLERPTVNQDLPFQHLTWRVQRIGWGVIALVLLSALSGIFGHGPLSETTLRHSSIPLSVEYERFGRYQSALTLHVHVHEGAAPQGTVGIWFSDDYLSKVHIQQIMPTPESAHISSTGMTYVFRVAQPEQPADIIVDLQAQKIGLISGRIGLDESHAFHFWQWIYP